VRYPDVDQMAATVRELLDDPVRRAAYGETGWRKVRHRHDVRVAAPRLHSALRTWAR
jgi:hypothetical protein